MCPKCLPKRERDLTSLREPVSMTVVVGNGIQVSREFKGKYMKKRGRTSEFYNWLFWFADRLDERTRLQEQNENLTHQLSALKTRHAELTISLKTQEEEKQELLVCEKSTKENIQRILDFVKNIKGTTATYGMGSSSTTTVTSMTSVSWLEKNQIDKLKKT